MRTRVGEDAGGRAAGGRRDAGGRGRGRARAREDEDAGGRGDAGARGRTDVNTGPLREAALRPRPRARQLPPRAGPWAGPWAGPSLLLLLPGAQCQPEQSNVSVRKSDSREDQVSAGGRRHQQGDLAGQQVARPAARPSGPPNGVGPQRASGEGGRASRGHAVPPAFARRAQRHEAKQSNWSLARVPTSWGGGTSRWTPSARRPSGNVTSRSAESQVTPTCPDAVSSGSSRTELHCNPLSPVLWRHCHPHCGVGCSPPGPPHVCSV